MKKSVSLICSELQGEARSTFIIQSIGVVVVEVKVRRM